MKYVRLTPRKVIMEIRDEKPQFGDNWVEISNAKAAEAQALKDNRQLPILFENAITTRIKEFESGNRFRWDEELGDYVRTPIPVYVPPSITPLQLRKALNAAGLRDTIESIMANAPRETVDAWEYATMVERNNPLVLQLAGALSLTKEVVDQVFIDAVKL